MSEEILNPWVDHDDGKCLCIDYKRGCCCCKDDGEDEVDYNTYENQRIMTIVDVFLHLDQVSDNHLTSKELEKFLKILEENKSEL